MFKKNILLEPCDYSNERHIVNGFLIIHDNFGKEKERYRTIVPQEMDGIWAKEIRKYNFLFLYGIDKIIAQKNSFVIF